MIVGTATIEISEARKQLNTLDRRLARERVITVLRHGKPTFALVELEYLAAMLETIEIMSDPKAMEMLRKSIKDIQQGRVHDHDDVEKEFG